MNEPLSRGLIQLKYKLGAAEVAWRMKDFSYTKLT